MLIVDNLESTGKKTTRNQVTHNPTTQKETQLHYGK
jgi:hypothetical protein